MKVFRGETNAKHHYSHFNRLTQMLEQSPNTEYLKEIIKYQSQLWELLYYNQQWPFGPLASMPRSPIQ